MTALQTIRDLFNIHYNCGFSLNEIETAEKRLKITLPTLLREYYLEFGANERINQTQDHLCEPQQLEIVNDLLIFYTENQYVCVWAISVNDLDKRNPPVYMNWDKNSSDWLLETNSLSEFLITMAYNQAQFALDYTSEELYYLEDDEIETIRRNFKQLEGGFKQWIKLEFYGNYSDSIIVVQTETNFVGYGSASENNFTEIDKILNQV